MTDDMRLSDDKVRRLSALVWRERARRWLPIARGVVVLIAGFAYILDTQMRRADRTADVAAIRHGGGYQAGRHGTRRRGHARSPRRWPHRRGLQCPAAHAAGRRAWVINEASHAYGKLTNDVMRLAD